LSHAPTSHTYIHAHTQVTALVYYDTNDLSSNNPPKKGTWEVEKEEEERERESNQVK
jgi:hypothetical protein